MLPNCFFIVACQYLYCNTVDRQPVVSAFDKPTNTQITKPINLGQLPVVGFSGGYANTNKAELLRI